MAAWGFLFLPLLIVIPNPQAVKNVSFQLLSLEGDYRYAFLFLLCLAPIAISLQEDLRRRGWFLVGTGSLMIILTLWFSGIAAEELKAAAESILPENTFVRNPRVRPVSAVAVGMAGGYLVLFGGLSDLRKAGIGQWPRIAASMFSVVAAYWLFSSGKLDAFSVMAEYRRNGDDLVENIIKQFAYVSVALLTGLVIGIGLGFWASRQERVAPIVLYIVGIIQTIPSLALFGLLLVPLSNLGRQEILNDILSLIIPVLVAMIILAYIVARFGKILLPRQIEFGVLVVIGTIATIPILVIVLMGISLLFQITFQLLSGSDYQAVKTIFLLFFLSIVFLNTFGKSIAYFRKRPTIYRRTRQALTVGVIGSALVALALTANDYLPVGTSLVDWKLSDIGIRGLGETPSLVALSLYSLLPLVRNTYTGLNNVDNAIIDSGRGMGMTPRQIFLKIELPLAFPVIMAGVRNAAIALVGIATIAHAIGGGALGEYVIEGATRILLDLILLGTIPAIALAFAMDAGLRGLETILTSPGIRQERERGIS